LREMKRKLTEKEYFGEINPEALRREDNIIRTLALTFTGMMKELEKEYGEGVVDVARRGFLKAKIEADKEVFEDIPEKTVTIYCDWLNSILHLTHEFEVECNDDGTECRYTFKACPWAKHFREFGGEKYGRFFCDADRPMVEAFSDDLGFKITKVLMDGEDCCDHYFYSKSALKDRENE